MSDNADSETVHDDLFYFTNVTFKVENTLFRVPRHELEHSSEVFRDMFLMPSGDQSAEGLSDECPIVLEDVSSSDFKQLLRAIFCRMDVRGPQGIQPRSFKEWTAVIKLTHRWQMHSLHQHAIDSAGQLSPGVDPVEKVSLAMTYSITRWMRPALNDMARREEALSQRDVDILGLDMVLKLARVRESIASKGRVGKRKVEELNFGPLIDEVFDELLTSKKPRTHAVFKVDFGKPDNDMFALMAH